MPDRRLHHHLVRWLGRWPPGRALDVVGSDRRTQPGWDGAIHPVIGVGTPAGTVLSVPPAYTAAVRALARLPMAEFLRRLPAVLDRPRWSAHRAVFRYTLAPAPGPDLGEWVDHDHPAVPDWLRPFGGEVLVAWAPDGGYAAGVGIKRHDGYGHELAVGTAPAYRGQGLARRLVAQAARRILDEGLVPTYLHAPDDPGAARVAEAAGFPDRGWSAYGITAGRRP